MSEPTEPARPPAGAATAGPILEPFQRPLAGWRRLRADLKAAEKSRRARYAAVTTPAPTQPLAAMTNAEVSAELGQADDQRSCHRHGGALAPAYAADIRTFSQFLSGIERTADNLLTELGSMTTGVSGRVEQTTGRLITEIGETTIRLTF